MIDQLTLDCERIEQEVVDMNTADDRNDDDRNDEEDEVDVGVQRQQQDVVHPRSSSYQNTPVGERTSRRTRNPNLTHCTDELMRHFGVMTTDDLFLADMGLDFGNLKCESSECKRMFALNVINTDEDGLLEYLHPLALAAKSNSKDILNF